MRTAFQGVWKGGWAKIGLMLALLGIAYAAGRRGQYDPPSAASAQSRVSSFQPGEIDLGRAPWFSDIPFAADFANHRAQPITIASVKSSCGCIGVDAGALAGTVLQPEARVRVTGRVEVGESLGQRTKEVSILLGTGEVETLLITYAGIATYVLSPDSLSFGEVDIAAQVDPPTKSIRFSSETTRILEPPQCDAPWIQAAVRETGEHTAEVIAQLAPDFLSHGRNYAQIKIVTDDRFRPVASVAISAEGRSELRPIPSRLLMRTSERKLVRFVTARGDAARLVHVECGHPDFDANIEPGGECVSVAVSPTTAATGTDIRVSDERGKHARVRVSLVK